MLAPFEIVLWQHPWAWSTCIQTPSGLFPPHHPNTFPLANTHYTALLISSSYCVFIQISSSLISVSSLAVQCEVLAQCGHSYLNIVFGSGCNHRHWVIFYCRVFENDRGMWRGLRNLGSKTHFFFF